MILCRYCRPALGSAGRGRTTTPSRTTTSWRPRPAGSHWSACRTWSTTSTGSSKCSWRTYGEHCTATAISLFPVLSGGISSPTRPGKGWPRIAGTRCTHAFSATLAAVLPRRPCRQRTDVLQCWTPALWHVNRDNGSAQEPRRQRRRTSADTWQDCTCMHAGILHSSQCALILFWDFGAIYITYLLITYLLVVRF